MEGRDGRTFMKPNALSREQHKGKMWSEGLGVPDAVLVNLTVRF
jgi:hypothetical protein